jgi:2-oxoisovalerate dehydrogenase E1 component
MAEIAPMQFDRKQLSNDELILFYQKLLWPRMIEEKMLLLLRQGRISKWFSGIGQEAIAVGATLAMQKDEWIMPLHRNLGVFTTRNMPLSKLFMQWQGAQEGFSKGRERSFHFGSKQHHICGMISHLGPQLAIGDGVALAYKLKKEDKVSLAFTGEGGTSEGDFHEALNVAAVWDLPIIFIIENNGYGLSTPTEEQYRCISLIDKAKGYGMDAVQIDGNNILTVYDTIKGVRDYCIRYQKPFLIECITFRMRGHEEASGTKYVPKRLFELWEMKDPVKNYEQYLVSSGVLKGTDVENIKNGFKEKIEGELQSGFDTAPVVADTETELEDVCAPKPQGEGQRMGARVIDNSFLSHDSPLTTHDLRLIDAIKQGLRQSMKAHSNLILMGQDIAEYGGAFKITEGFVEEFGKEESGNTPLCESANCWRGIGLSLKDTRVIEMQFADFVTVGFNQIINNLAKIHYRWGQKCGCSDSVCQQAEAWCRSLSFAKQ